MATYFIIGGDTKEYGPISQDDLRQWIAEGRLNGQSLAKSEGDISWRTLASFPEFADVLAGAPLPAISASGAASATSDPNWQAEVLTRMPDLKVDECLAAGFSFFSTNAAFVVGTVFLVWLLNGILALGALFIPLLGPIAFLCFTGVLMGGLYLACLRRLRGENVSPVEALSGIQGVFGQLVLAGLVSTLLTEFSFCCLILPCIYLAVAWIFTLLLVADKKMFFWSAMELSRKVVTRVWFGVFVLLLLTFLPVLIVQLFSFYKTGIFLLDLYHQSGGNVQQLTQIMQEHMEETRALSLKMTGIVQVILLLNLFYAVGVLVRAYENLFGARKK